MSSIRLNNIQVNYPVQGEEFLYLGAIIQSDSGVLFPKMIKSLDQLVTTFGSFKYDQMYKDLLNRNIPLCLLPILTKESKYNRCSLRLNHSLPPTHPKYEVNYHKDTYGDYYAISPYTVNMNLDLLYVNPADLVNEDIDGWIETEESENKKVAGLDYVESDILKEKQTYSIVLDFTDVKLSDLKDTEDYHPYIILPLGKYENDGTWDLHRLITNGDAYKYVSQSDFTRIEFYSKDFNCTTDYEVGNDVLETIESIKNNYNLIDIVNTKCYTVEDIFYLNLSKIQKIIGNPELDLDNEPADYKNWRKRIIDQVFIEDYYLISNNQAYKVILRLLKGFDEEGKDWKYDFFSYVSDHKDWINLKIPKLLFTFDRPVKLIQYFSIPGLKVSSNFRSTQDILSSYTDEDKVVEFYAKYKGPVGENIRINIIKVDNYSGRYRISIENDYYQELYDCYLYDLENEYENLGLIHITKITELSNLVEVKFYNYDIGNHEYIDARYFDSAKYGEYKNENKRPVEELSIQPGNYRLARACDEEYDDDDVYDTLELYKTSDWYPDLFLVDKVFNKAYLEDVLDAVDNELSKGDGLEPDLSSDWTSLCSQALINLTGYQLAESWRGGSIRKYYVDPTYISKRDPSYKYYPDKNNRMLYFHGDIIIENELYPSFYPYILNLLYQQYLKIPKDKFIYDPFSYKLGNSVKLTKWIVEKNEAGIIVNEYWSPRYDIAEITHISRVGNKIYISFKFEDNTVIETLLTKINQVETNDTKYKLESILELVDKYRVNFLQYDNLNYFYKNIKDQIQQSSIFMIRYIAAKYTREVYKIKARLTGISEDEVNSLLAEVQNNCDNYLTYVEDSSLTAELENYNTLKVTLMISVPQLINKTFMLNFIINV